MISLLPRGVNERWSWQLHFLVLISQCAQFQNLTVNESGITPAKKVEILRLSKLISLILTRREGPNFIREAMKSAAITNEALAQKLNVIRNNVQLWFKKDDITISNIYKIAEGYGWEVNITFKLKKV